MAKHKKPCGKIGYRTAQDARASALRQGQLIGDVYRCPHCPNAPWHLSRHNPKRGRRKQW